MLKVATMMHLYVYAGPRMGAEVPPPTVPRGAEPRRGLLAEVAPHVAPAMGPISVKKTFDERQILNVEICVDDKCYRTSMNLGPAITLVMEKLAQGHKDQPSLITQHPAQGQQQTPVMMDVVGAVDAAIAAAGDAMADTLVCHHVNVMTGSFFDDVGSAIGGTLRELAPVIMWTGGQGGAVTTSAGWYSAPMVGSFWDAVGNAVLTVTGTKATNQFIHDHGLEPYVKFASQAVATFYGGPAAGAAASAISPMVMKLGVKDKAKAAAAQQDVQGVTALAQQHSPQMAQAVDVAKGSIKGVSTAYHINHLLKLAKGGDARAQRALARLQSLASSGNLNAQRALQVVNAIHQEQTNTAVSGWYDVVGAVLSAGKRDVSLTAGTIMDRTHTPLTSWF
jgi:hypothetical protein